MQTLHKPELMSPAGHWPQLKAAIEAGADAVYLGLNHFSARAKVGFDLVELPDVLGMLHERGVKGFVTFNTLVFDHELKQAESAIVQMAHAGVDAIIVQDVGIARLARDVSPELEIHGSTQMSITSAQGAELAKSLGCSRVVLGRELSLSDIRRIADSTDVELEVFVHGALCVSYSGQCFSSEAWGGRSANRGQCAQACRLSYDLIVDGQPRDLGPYRYLLSPGDLFALEQIPELIDIGIACVKIEGRYKDANYVAATTRAYRQAIDQASEKRTLKNCDRIQDELEQLYSRGLGPWFMSGVDHQQVVRGRAPRHRGLLIGTVEAVGNNSVHVVASRSVEPGDGLVFDAADWRSPDEPEEGGHVYEVRPFGQDSIGNGRILELSFGRGEIDFSRIRPGDLVWRTRDPQLIKKMKPIAQANEPVFTRAVDFEVTAIPGLPIEIVASLPTTGRSSRDDSITEGTARPTATFIGSQPVQPAQNRPLDVESLALQLGRLGGTPFHLGRVTLDHPTPVFVPASELNQARRDLVEELLANCRKPRSIKAVPKLERKLSDLREIKQPSRSTGPHLHVLVRTADQLDATIEALARVRKVTGQTLDMHSRPTTDPIEPASITLDYLELYGLRPSVDRIREAGFRARVASPRILKPAEQNVCRFLSSLECDILVRSGGLLWDLVSCSTGNDSNSSNQPVQLIGDFSLNAANALTCQQYLEMGITRITPTYDLNARQIQSLTRHVVADRLEVIAYSHLPVFHTEHCVFCRFLSEGTDHTNCGHPCEQHRLAVRDSQGRHHPVMADVGCRNTVFGAQAQTSPRDLHHWLEAGIQHFRIEFVHQTAEQIHAIIEAFAEALSGAISQDELDRRLKRHSPQDTTPGSLFVPADYQQLVQLNASRPSS